MSQRLDYDQIAPRAVKALGGVYAYVAQSGLPAEMVATTLSVPESMIVMSSESSLRTTTSGAPLRFAATDAGAPPGVAVSRAVSEGRRVSRVPQAAATMMMATVVARAHTAP